MNSSDVLGLSVQAAKTLLDRGEVSSYELTRSVLDRIREVDGRVNAFVTVTEDEAMAQACSADRRIADGDTGPLTGVPMQIKDNMCARSVATTCSTRSISRAGCASSRRASHSGSCCCSSTPTTLSAPSSR